MPSWKKVIISGSDAALNTLNVTTAFTASGLNYPTADNGVGSFLQTNGSGNLSFQYVKTIYEEIHNGETTQILKGTPLYISGAVGATSVVYRADAGNASKMPVVYISADNIAPGATGRGIALGLITGVNTTGYPAGTEIYVAVGGGWTSTRPTGSAIVQTLGYVTKEGNGGQGVVLNPGPNSLPNLPSGSVWVGNSNSIPTPVLTSSLSVASASFAATSSFTTAVSGTTNYVSKFTGVNTLGNSQIFDNGTNVGIGTTSPGARLDVRAQGALSTDIAFRVRNSADTVNIMRVNGDGTLTFSNDGTNSITFDYAGGTSMRMNGDRVVQRSGTSTIFGGTQSYLSLRTNSSERLGIDDNGLVSINGAPTTSAQLSINSTTRGFLPPRMTTTQRNAIATPAAGLIVYDTTDNKHYGYNGTSWASNLTNTGDQSITGSLSISQGITGSLFGTASFASTASFAISSSNAQTASFLNTLNQDLTFNGNLTLNGTASISTLVINQTQYSSGSNQLGDGIEDTQTLFGTVRIPTGSLTVTGSISSTSLTGSDSRIVVADPQGTLQSTTQTIIQAYLDPNSSQVGLLNNTSNWDIYGIYTGPQITDTFQGQKHYNTNYFFEAVDDNVWIRLIRG